MDGLTVKIAGKPLPSRNGPSCSSNGEELLTYDSYSGSFDNPPLAAPSLDTGAPAVIVPTVISASFPTCPYRQIYHPSDGNLLTSGMRWIVRAFCIVMLLAPALVFLFTVVPLAMIIRLTLTIPHRLRGGVPAGHFDLRWKTTSQCVLAVVRLEPGLELCRVRDLVNARVICAESKRGCRNYPRFLQLLVSRPTGFVWINDPNFQLDRHIVSSATINSTERGNELQHAIEQLASDSLPLDQPLWQFTILLDKGIQGESLVLVARIHPALIEGITLTQFLCDSLADEPLPMSSSSAAVSASTHTRVACPSPSRPSNYKCSTWRYMSALFQGPFILMQHWFRLGDHNLLHPIYGHRDLSRPDPRLRYMQHSLDLAKLSRIRQIVRCTYNDLFVACVSGALRAYQQVQGINNPFECSALLPVRIGQDKLALVSVPLPTNTEGAIPRLWASKIRMAGLKKAADWPALYFGDALLHVLLPSSLAGSLQHVYTSGTTAMLCNLRGPSRYLQFARRRVQSLSVWFPLALPQQAVSFTFASYADHVTLALCVNETQVRNPEILLEAIHKQIDLLTLMVLHRRIPGEQRSHRIGTSLATNMPGSFGLNSGASLVVASCTSTATSSSSLGVNNGSQGTGGGLSSTPTTTNQSALSKPILSMPQPFDPLHVVSNSSGSAPQLALSAKWRDRSVTELHMRLAAVQMRLQEAATKCSSATASSSHLDPLKLEFRLLMEELKRRHAHSGDFDDEPDDEVDLIERKRRRGSRAASFAMPTAFTRRRSTSAVQSQAVRAAGGVDSNIRPVGLVASRPHSAVGFGRIVDTSPCNTVRRQTGHVDVQVHRTNSSRQDLHHESDCT